MRMISSAQIKNAVSGLCLKANFYLRQDMLKALKKSCIHEENRKAKAALEAIIKNAQIAKNEKLAICQDTGLPCVFVELGSKVKISGDLNAAINQGVAAGYKRGSLRNSIIKDPLLRGKSGYSPAVIHVDIVSGDKLKLTVLPKGFGCENKTQLKMFKPTAKIEEIKKFVIEAVKSAGADACPPYVIGVGIGGSAESACLSAKKALLRKITSYELRVTSYVAKLENELLREINKLEIGPMGFGGKNTALAVNIRTQPTHIAGLPVCVNFSCHALRSASAVL